MSEGTLLITGSRNATFAMMKKAREAVQRAHLLGWHIVVGDAIGIDFAVLCECHDLGTPFKFYGVTEQPRHKCCKEHLYRYTRVSGSYLARDRHMVDLPEVNRVLAIWDGRSKGTQYTFRYAMDRLKHVDVMNFEAQR